LHDMRSGELLMRNDKGQEQVVTGSDIGDPYPALAPARHLVDLFSENENVTFAPALSASWAVELLEVAYISAATKEIVKIAN